MNEMDRLNKEIELRKNKLFEIYTESHSLDRGQVLRDSQELDRLIVQYQQLQIQIRMKKDGHAALEPLDNGYEMG